MTPVQIEHHPYLRYFSESDDVYNKYQRPSFPRLPVSTTVKGKALLIRNIEPNDEKIIFSLLGKDTQDDGIGVDEFPTFEYFRSVYLKSNYVFVSQLESNGEVVGAVICREVPFVRSERHASHAWFMVTSPKFQGQGFGSALQGIAVGCCYLLGYKRLIGSKVLTNKKTGHMVEDLQRSRPGGSFGVIRKAIYLKGVGWSDLELGGVELDDSDMAKLQRLVPSKV